MNMADRTILYFLVKDPHWTFLWWNIASGAPEKAGVAPGSGAIQVLRIYDVTHILFDGRNAHHSFDVEITGETDHWYLNIESSNRNYLAEIGYRFPDGRFAALARSNTIYLPRDQAAETVGETWSTIILE